MKSYSPEQVVMQRSEKYDDSFYSPLPLPLYVLSTFLVISMLAVLFALCALL